MKIRTIFIIMFFFAAFIACSPKEDKSSAPAETSKLQTYAYAEKDEFIKKMKAELNKVNMELMELETKAKTLKKEAKSEAKQKIQMLKDKSNALNKQIDKAKNATEATWNGIMGDFNKSFSEIKDSVEQTRTWLSKKIAP
ncbi:MAG: hypothetical protein V1874_03715 [Spirochaetota bacterium]